MVKIVEGNYIQKLDLKDTILDGELVYFADDGRTDFDELRKGIRERSEHEGREMTRIPLIERKEILGSILYHAGPSIRLSEHLYEDGEIVHEQACRPRPGRDREQEGGQPLPPREKIPGLAEGQKPHGGRFLDLWFD